MDEPMVSVIIPVYKAEQFLDECLNSIISQDYPALEIILVDDGSPDSCPERCDWYAETYDYVKTIHKKNEGPGMARNTGLEAATGKYIAFVDSDDCLDGAGAIRQLVVQAEKKQADIIVGSYRLLKGRPFGRIRHHQLKDGAYTGTVDFRFKGFTLYNHLTSPWGKLYLRSFLADNDLKFRNYPFAEDKLLNMICCTYKPVYTFVDESVYLYRVNDDSITSRYQDDYYLSVYPAIASDFGLFLSERGITEEYNDLVVFHLFIGLFFLATQKLKHKGMSETVKALSNYGKNPLVRKAVTELVRGKYINQIEQKIWRAMIWGASLLCSLHAYVLLALGVWALQKVRADDKSLV